MIYSTRGFANPGISLGTPPERTLPRMVPIPADDPDHPARRFELLGGAALSTRELLTLLLDPGRGHARASAAAGALLHAFGADEGGTPLRTISRQPTGAVASAAGIGSRAAARLLAALELGGRTMEEERRVRDRISSPRDVYTLFRYTMRDLVQEEFHVLLLNTQNHVLRDVTVTRGTLDASLVHPREVFRPALSESAASIIVAHNHPSGEPTPSPEDREVTRQLVEVGKTMGIPILDHVVIGDNRYVSFVESGLMEGG